MMRNIYGLEFHRLFDNEVFYCRLASANDKRYRNESRVLTLNIDNWVKTQRIFTFQNPSHKWDGKKTTFSQSRCGMIMNEILPYE
jgi:hypothetical protein